MNFVQDFQCRTAYGVDWTNELHLIFPVRNHIWSGNPLMNFIEGFPVHDHIFGVDWTDEFHPRFLVQDHVRSVCEGVFSRRWFFVPYFRIWYFCTGILGGSFF
jgi:hypothetical protein